MKPRSGILRVLALSLAFLMAGAVQAQQAADEARNRARLKNWQHRMESADQMLQAKKYRKAGKLVDRLIDDMVDEIATGDAKPLLAMASLLRALSEAGLGHERNALWDLHVAKVLDERIGSTDLSAYGEAGALLSQPRQSAWDRESYSNRSDVEELEPPVKVEVEAPKYPLGKRYECLQDVVLVQSVVDENGIPQEPMIAMADDSILAFAAMQALRDWRFQPARLDGEPVHFVHNLSMSFRLPRCES